MASATRQSMQAAIALLEPKLASADLTLAAELFAASQAIASSSQLRSLLTDPSAESSAKAKVIDQVFGKRLGPAAHELLGKLVALRWSAPRDLTLSLEQLAVRAVAAISATQGKLDELEAELFGFTTAVASDGELQFALSSRQATSDAKLELVTRLIAGKLSAAAELLIANAVRSAGRRRLAQLLEQFQRQIADYGNRLVATVTSATPLSAGQLERLEQLLAALYGKHLRLNVQLDPEIIGGLKIQVAGEVIDGSLQSKINQARLQLA